MEKNHPRCIECGRYQSQSSDAGWLLEQQLWEVTAPLGQDDKEVSKPAAASLPGC